MKCFIIAMKGEAAPLLAAMKIEKDYSLFGKRIVLGNAYGTEFYVIVCGAGKVNAASGAQLAVDLGCDEIINIGVAGGLNADTKVGEIYCVSKVFEYDLDLTQLGIPLGALHEGENGFCKLFSNGLYPEKVLATGDRFNDSEADNTLLTKTVFADLRDMEGAAIARVCKSANAVCRMYKIVSDVYGSGSTTEQFDLNFELCLEKMKAELEKIILNS